MTNNNSQSFYDAPDHDELMIEIGSALYEEAGIMGVRPPSTKQLIDRANRWLSSSHQEISSLIKSNPEVIRLAYESKPRDIQRLIALISDGLSSPFVGFPISTAALLIVHFYLDHYIKEQNDKKTP